MISLLNAIVIAALSVVLISAPVSNGLHSSSRDLNSRLSKRPHKSSSSSISHGRADSSRSRSCTSLSSSVSALQKYLSERFGGTKDEIEELIPRTEADELLEFINYKPWRAEKIKHLQYRYKPWTESWKETFRDSEDDTVTVYTYPQQRTIFQRDRLDEVWFFPWLWSQLKAERQCQLQKHFNADYEQLTAQEHIEMDCFLSEFDMGVRWSLVRFSEVDILNTIALNLVALTDFNGVKPTDLGLRPDGSVRLCPVQFHTCISSSNRDAEHYAPPLRWSRSKSPDQAYEEIKSVFYNYPSRGLSWSKGWIDRGGWLPQQFNGPYFRAKAESEVWHWAEDVEFRIDNDRREVQYRSSARVGQIDWDVERLRYNEVVLLLDKKGGWENHPLQKSFYLRSTPWRWMQRTLDSGAVSVEQLLDRTVNAFNSYIDDGGRSSADSSGSSSSRDAEGAARRAIQQLIDFVAPYVQPVLTNAAETATEAAAQLRLDPRVAAALQLLQELQQQQQQLQQQFEDGIAEQIQLPQIQQYARRIGSLLSDQPIPTARIEDLKIPLPATTSSSSDTSSSTTTSSSSSSSSSSSTSSGSSSETEDTASASTISESSQQQQKQQQQLANDNEFKNGWSNALLRGLKLQQPDSISRNSNGIGSSSNSIDGGGSRSGSSKGFTIIDKNTFREKFLQRAAGSSSFSSSSSRVGDSGSSIDMVEVSSGSQQQPLKQQQQQQPAVEAVLSNVDSASSRSSSQRKLRLQSKLASVVTTFSTNMNTITDTINAKDEATTVVDAASASDRWYHTAKLQVSARNVQQPIL